MFSIVLLLSYGVLLESCVVPESNPSWSLSSGKSLSRTIRQVTLEERADCGVNSHPPDTREDTAEKVDKLIALMKAQNLDAYIIPTSDEHLSEYTSEFDERRRFISGFKGSAGTAVVLSDGGRALWTDGRYFLQADQELDCNWLLMKEEITGVPTIPEWLKEKLKPDAVVGADPKLISAMEWLEYEKLLKESQITMKPIAKNLVDELRPGREDLGEEEIPIQMLELQFAGKKWEDKIGDLRKELEKHNADMIVITAMDENAWLFNLRGGDVPYNPVFRSYAIIDQQKIRLFLDKKISPEVDLHLHMNQCGNTCIEIINYSSIIGTLSALTSLDSVKKVVLPSKYSYSGGASYAIYSAVPENKRIFTVSPVLLMKAQKNPVEQKGMRNAHIKDAVALIDFLSFMQQEMESGNSWDEISAAKRLEKFRVEQDLYHSLSFETISAFGSNGAIIHYSPVPQTNKQITNESLYLLDSGGQYKDGTTDVTRTLHYGTPTAFEKEAYTRVLKGAIDVALLTFPKGTLDTRVDVLARRSLYEVGLDYRHGTGHGIGMFLNVHEAPTQMRIYGKEEHELKEGYFFSDEPGYYKAGDFGIRLETILTVVPKTVKYEDFPMLGFEAVTLVPFEPKLIEVTLLENRQCHFLNVYHEQVREMIGQELEKQGRSRAKAYMMDKTKPLDCSQTGVDEETGALQREQVVERKISNPQQATVSLPNTNSGTYTHNSFQFSIIITTLVLGRHFASVRCKIL